MVTVRVFSAVSVLGKAQKILVVTVLEGLYIITTDVSAPENRNKVITLAVNKEIPGVTSQNLRPLLPM
jgi:hypothetical protein